MKEKEYTYLVIRFESCLIKNLTKKTQWDKTWLRKKEYNAYFTPPDEDQDSDVGVFAFQS